MPCAVRARLVPFWGWIVEGFHGERLEIGTSEVLLAERVPPEACPDFRAKVLAAYGPGGPRHLGDFGENTLRLESSTGQIREVESAQVDMVQLASGRKRAQPSLITALQRIVGQPVAEPELRGDASLEAWKAR